MSSNDTPISKPVDLDGLEVVIDKIKEDFAKKSEIPAMNYATTEEILALFDDKTVEAGSGEETVSGDGENIDDDS